MIYSFGLRNFSCFKEGVDVSFELNEKVPFEISKGRPVTRVLGIKGANGSGKTQLLKGLSFLSRFCTVSFHREEGAPIPIDPHFRNSDPIDFYVDFEYNGSRYFYELSTTDREVISERLLKGVRKTRVFERLGTEITYRLKKLAELDLIVLKGNCSLISSAHNYKLKAKKEELDDAYSFFLWVFSNVGYTGWQDSRNTVEQVSKDYFNEPKAFEFTKKIILECDLGISDIQIFERTVDGKKEYYPGFVHKHGEKDHYLTDVLESSGTVALYKHLWLYWITLRFGGVLALDEFDIHFHEMILPKIIDLFDDEEINTTGAQFIFTCHNTELMDKLGKYRTILVNKEGNESYCYRLDEIPGGMIRNDRPISPLYKQGKIGGVPKL